MLDQISAEHNSGPSDVKYYEWCPLTVEEIIRQLASAQKEKSNGN